MSKNQHYKIFISIFFLWLFMFIPNQTVIIISYFSVMTLGIYHGSNDIQLIKKLNKNNNSNLLLASAYIVILLLSIILFIFSKTITFLIFITLSSYHFGEQHLHKKKIGRKQIEVFIYLLHGLFIFSLLFINKYEEVISISSELFRLNLHPNIFKTFTIISGCFYFTTLFVNYYKSGDYSTIFEEIIYSVFFFIFFKASSLIVGFSLYFIIWHSIPSIYDQILFLHKKISKSTLKLYLKKSFALWLLSLLSVYLIYYFFGNSYLFESIIFGVLFAISTPHIFVMLFMNLIKKK